jgi:hypothetical protein
MHPMPRDLFTFLLALPLLAISGCVDIPLKQVGPGPEIQTAAIHVGMPPEQVHAAMGLPEYVETTHNWLGFNTGHLQEVYSYSVRSEHFYVAFAVIACAPQGPGVISTRNDYRIVVGYDSNGVVASCAAVPLWQHPRDSNAITPPPTQKAIPG